MKILNWKKFNESLDTLETITFKIPVAVLKKPSSNLFLDRYTLNLNDIVNKLDDNGFDGLKFSSEFDEWYERNCPEKPGDEPDSDDYDDEDDYNADYENWEDQQNEYDNFGSDPDELVDKFIGIYYGGISSLIDSFKIFDVIDNVCDNNEKEVIFKKLKNWFELNSSGLNVLESELTDEAEYWSKNDSEYSNFDSYETSVVGDKFDNGYLVMKIESNNGSINMKRLDEKIYYCITHWADYIIDIIFDLDYNLDAHIHWGNDASKEHGIEEYRVVYPELESYEYQKKFLDERPEDYKLLEPFGINTKIKDEFDYLWSGENMGLM
jgi:hypothetical protein